MHSFNKRTVESSCRTSTPLKVSEDPEILEANGQQSFDF